MEYEENAGGASLLSSLNDGEFITVYANLSPISLEEIRTLYGGDEMLTELQYIVNDIGTVSGISLMGQYMEIG